MDLKARMNELNDLELDDVLKAPVVQQSATERLTKMLRKPQHEGKARVADDALFGALTIGDLLYDMTRVDPTVLEAADFARG